MGRGLKSAVKVISATRVGLETRGYRGRVGDCARGRLGLKVPAPIDILNMFVGSIVMAASHPVSTVGHAIFSALTAILDR